MATSYYVGDPNHLVPPPLIPTAIGEFPPDISIPGRIPVDPVLDPNQQTIILLCLGASGMGATVNGAHIAISPDKIDQLNILDGGVYRAIEPLLGDNEYEPGTHGVPIGHQRGSLPYRIADYLATAGFCDRVILVVAAVGGSASYEWMPGGTLNHRIKCVGSRLRAHSYSPALCLWGQGFTDAFFSIPKATYKSNTFSIFDDVRSNGITCPILVERQGGVNFGFTQGGAWINEAQDELVNGIDIFAGADQELIGPEWRWDGLHFTVAGAGRAAADYYGKIKYAMQHCQ